MSPLPVKAARKIPFFNYPALYAARRDEFLSVFDDVCGRGAYILQKDLADFEARLAEFTGSRHVIGVANGTDAILLALRAAGIGPGDEVILPSHTYVATAASVHYLGAVPVLVECGPDHMIDPAAVEAAVTRKTRAILPVQLNGRTCDMDALGGIAKKNGLWIVEDAAQACGSKFKGRCAGTFGIAGTYSFYPAKLLGCFGDGGCVLTQDDAVAEKIYRLRDHGRGRDGTVDGWGFNSRLDNLQAAILAAKLSHYDEDILRRRRIAALYREGLSQISEIVLPPGPDNDPDHFDVYQNYEIEAVRRDELKAFLSERGVQTIIQWGGVPVHRLPGLGFGGLRLPVTERLFERCLLLPMNTSLSDDDVRYICSVIAEFYGQP